MLLAHVFLALLFLQTPKPGSVSGTVTNSATGGPVRKARVTLRWNENVYTAATDAEGHFQITNVSPGVFQARVECVGFEASQRPEPLRVDEDQRIENLAFSLTPHGVITGKVVDENGEPMARMSVTVQGGLFGRNGRTAGMMQTDDRGVYRFFDLPAGSYLVMASNPSLAGSPNGRLHSEGEETAYVSEWFPGVPDASQATASTLIPGGELSGIDIRMRKVRVYHIRGKVAWPGGQPRLEAPVILAPCENSTGQGFYAPVLRDGSFDAIDIVPGVWCASVELMIDDTHGLYARQTVAVSDHDVNNVVLTVAPTAAIRGQVLVDGDAPTKMQPSGIRLEPVENPGRGVTMGPHPDGTFTGSNVQPGTYRVSLGLPGMYVKAVRFNGQESRDGRITITGAGGELTLLMATDSGEISGTVQGAAIVTASLSGSGEVAIMSGVAGGGNFRIVNLAPGDYQVLAWDSRDFELVQYGEFRKQFESRAVRVTVHPRGHENVSVTAIPAAEVDAAKARLR